MVSESLEECKQLPVTLCDVDGTRIQYGYTEYKVCQGKVGIMCDHSVIEDHCLELAIVFLLRLDQKQSTNKT